ncbi:glycosyltransferase family 25 protein [Helicobacter cappadocius]|uniref:Glycosyltransferase family 25 protein n=1 Tax=Helicobacter cappadocius TaxID=3063998 RepID=A0AA90TA27_9HELI|nr:MULTISPECIES: glycosyltransferase family 25 protein [unclassified Helicobacter]MDO7253569.1 glycosyltransferase family 25 protein [Helicobacter sp. faydin-H75]MDP2539497.1 glycosyltransferase family 25 protein [Helicobacter sp. faydin-H76]
MKIFIINLDRAKDRKEFMQNQINKLSDLRQVEFIFFDAIDAKNDEHHRFVGHYRKFLAISNGGRELKESEKACYASHFSLWQKCVELGEPIVILEDDIELLPEFIEGIKRIFSSSYEYVRLMGLDTSNKSFIELNEHFSLTYDEVLGTQGYYLTAKGAKKFIKGSKYWVLPVDNYMDRVFIHGVRNILHMPFLIKENDQMSANTTIPNRYENDKMKKPFSYRVSREFCRLYNQIRKRVYIFIDKSFL